MAADVATIADLKTLVGALRGLEGISAIKTGLTLAIQGLERAVDVIKTTMGKECLVIHDPQKGGTDTPDMAIPFVQQMTYAGVDSVILFPFAGPETQTAWTKECLDAGLGVLTGGIMTHSGFLASEGGYIDDNAVEKIYRLACQLGVRDFVVPGTKIDWVDQIRDILQSELGEEPFGFYAPGFLIQGGVIADFARATAGYPRHAIVGRAICDADGPGAMRAVAMRLVQNIRQDIN